MVDFEWWFSVINLRTVNKLHRYVPPAFVLVSLTFVGCSQPEAPKAYGRFGACLLGADATADRPARARALRSLQLGSGAEEGQNAWPTRCNQHADGLYAASSDLAVVRRTLEKQFGCKEGGGCTLPNDETLAGGMSALWDAADAAKLIAEPAPDVAGPRKGQAPAFDAASWTRLTERPVKVVSPRLTADGRGQFLLVPKERSEGLVACELPMGAGELSFFVSNPAASGISAQSIRMTQDARGFFAGGLTADGMRAFDLKTGEACEVRGTEQSLVSDGLAVETEGKPVAVVLRQGKAGKDMPLEIQAVGAPIVAGGQVVYLSEKGEAVVFSSKVAENGKLKDDAAIPGKFAGPLHKCEREGMTAVAAYAPHVKQRDGKPTAGADATQVTMVFHDGKGWSNAVEATMPFRREVESDLVCTKTGASLTWARPVEGGTEVGRLDCSASGCKSSQQKLPKVESKWWWTVAPLGEQVLLVWRAGLGEARLRVGKLAELPTATDKLLFDSAEFGGPEAGEAYTLVRDFDALVLFRSELPVAMRIAPDGSATLLKGK